MNKLTRELKVIVRNGKAELDLPDFPDGEVIVQVERPFNPETDWTPEEWAELQRLMQPDPKSGAEVVAMIQSGELDLSAWDALNIDDPVEWLAQQRAKRRKS